MSLPQLAIISCPYGQGGQYLGAEEGPRALYEGGLIQLLEVLDFKISSHFISHSSPKAASWKSGFHNLSSLLPVIKTLKKITLELLEEKKIPCILGGDHSLSMGSISGIAEYCYTHHKKLFVLWFDAHADSNTPQTSPTGNLHGMPVAHLCGWGDPLILEAINKEHFLTPDQFYFFGLRSIDAEEENTLKDNPFHVYTMKDIHKRGLPVLLNETLSTLKQYPNAHVHVSFDIDVLDASLTPGTGTPEKEGLTLEEVRQAFSILYASRLVHSLDIMELNPLLDPSHQTTQRILSLIPSLFGETLEEFP